MNNNLNIPTELTVRVDEILVKINDFSTKVLSDTYTEKFTELLEVLANTEENKLLRGKSNTWAAGVVHAIFFVNDTLNKKGIRMDELADLFEVSEGTIGAKSREIRKFLNIDKTSKKLQIKEECSSCCDSEENFVDLFDKALEIEDVEKGAVELRKCADIIKTDLGEDYLKTYTGQIGISAEGDFYLTVLSTLSNYEFALGNYEKSFEIEKGLLELDEYDSRNVRHSIIFRALINKDYDYALYILDKYNEEDCIFFKYGYVLYYYYKNDRKSARKALKKALKHNRHFIDCLVGNINTAQGEISSYKKGSLEEASLCIEYSLPLWTNEKIGNWVIKALNKIK